MASTDLGSNKAIPLDHVPIEFIKMSSSIISLYLFLSEIFNNCISSRVSPDVLKIAQIMNQFYTPIHKTGSYVKC